MALRQDFDCSPDELEALITQYFDQCDQEGKYYSEAGLCYAINIPISRYKSLIEHAYKYTEITHGKNKYKQDVNDDSIQWPHLEVLARQVLRIAEQLAQRTDKMALAQVRNSRLGGYEDRPSAAAPGQSGPIKVELEIKGTKKGTDPFG